MNLIFSFKIFASLLGLVGTSARLAGRVAHNAQHVATRDLKLSPILFEATLFLGETASVSKRVTTPAIPQNLEFCLLSDATGSFIDDQANLRAAASGIAKRITAASPGALFGYAAFKDTGRKDDFVYSLRQTLTTDIKAWLTAINDLRPYGGGDTQDAQWDGIACAVDIKECPTDSEYYSDEDCGFTSSDTSRKVLVVTTDAPFSKDKDIQNNLESTTAALVDNGVVLIGLKAKGAGKELDYLAKATGGSIIPLSPDGRNVADAILMGLARLPTTVVPDPHCDDLIVTFDPSSVTVISGKIANFGESIEVKDDPSLRGTVVTCTVDFLNNDVSIGTQTISITVNDWCPTTVLDSPTERLGVNRWALLNEGDTDFETVEPKKGFDVGPGKAFGVGPGKEFTIAGTHGCSCAQIIEICGYGKGHLKFGCSISVMEAFSMETPMCEEGGGLVPAFPDV
uniref:VWFA domain-containing protein n=1 Tax=Attheya septentrionalis TaxID=420275 RepID=A0A7S2XRI6_9STRA|mmetsp:Transcript_23315/g.42074  ORF Transcript_23315/g.42074 Transcript_23315/m.42074 type:complete len:455 (+) Transcript_23315:426-1790(+)|eukprot:CAMPEP_0198294046 /NCGR_PEP_ID=MMETSP1449-20131203/20284_1 /TAXON_ID=420275 /ORGANISM="Attheya septentrionalis, Strain CCMP2084" /LENGTH=454 /DNA_ID=CAMNT_0043993865 /DNA_START=375 /DNA_END=1739 /DNA_ORIENTATION=-